MAIHPSLMFHLTSVQTAQNETEARGETINSAATAARARFDEALAEASQTVFAYDAVKGNGTPEADAAWKAQKLAFERLFRAKVDSINAYDNCER